MNTTQGTPQETPQGVSMDKLKKHRLFAGVFAFVTLVGFVYVFGVFDSFTNTLLSDPKDYKAEEKANLELVKGQNNQYDKLVDESAEQFINEVLEEEVDTAQVADLPELEPEPEPEGEEF